MKCHTCVYHRMIPAEGFLLAYDHHCTQTGAAVPDPDAAPAWCPYRAIPNGAIKQRADNLSRLLDLGMVIGVPQMAELQADVARMVGDADEGLLDELHALQHRLGTYPVQP